MRLRTILFVLALLAFLSAFVGGFFYYLSVSESAVKQSEAQGAGEAEAMKERLSSLLAEHQRAVRALAGVKEVREALVDGGAQALVRANAVLEQLQQTFEVSACYVLNRDGDTIAASRTRTSESFVGQNYSFRPYFREAVQGRPAIFMGVGVTSGARGIYHSQPVRVRPKGDPVGVVVVKASMEALQREFRRSSNGLSFLVDEHGLILGANREEWLNQILWKRTPELLSGVAEPRPLGDRLWNQTGLEMRENHRAVDGKGNEYLVCQVPMDRFPGWQLVCLVSVNELSRKTLAPLLRTGFPVVISLCVLVGLAVLVLYTAASGDIARQKETVDGLRASEEKYRTVLEANPDPVVVCDQESRLLYFNPAFTRLFGWTLEERLGKPLEGFVPEDNHAETKVMMERLMAGESFFGLESRRYSKGGGILPVSVSGTVFRDRDGNPVGSIINLRDITEQKKLQGQLQHAQKMEAVGTLAGGIAHDFNNLLQAVQGYAELLFRGKPKDHPDCPSLQKILNAARRGAELTRQLLTFSRKVESRKRPLDLNYEVHEVQRLLERTLPRMIDIELHLADDLKIVNADPVQMEQVLMNLAVNSKDAMPQGGRLVVESKNVTLDAEFCKAHLGSKPGEYVMLAVSDTGHGMDNRTIAHIFEPFYTTKGPGKGTGLGLAMVYGIVKDHEGYITCHSAPGIGTTFKIYLPVVHEPAEVPVERKRERSTQVKNGKETILLVDDEEFIRDVAVQLLREFGYTVLTAPNGEAALDIYRKEQGRIDLVILDLIMPGMGGMKCLRELLKLDPQGRILVASGYSAGGPAREAIDAGARGYLGKPYDIDKMLTVIRNVLDKLAGGVTVH
jgi:PAS domain S-box-containing protein